MAIEKEPDPYRLFAKWYEDAAQLGLKEPTAVSLATADAQGRPSARMVLLKGFDERGFVFYTNLESRKGRQLRENPNAALCFHWMPADRQVRVEGPVVAVPDAEADKYFASRSMDSQIGAWASRQSQPLGGWMELERRVAKYALRYAVGGVPRPDFWSGFRIEPTRIEFWELGKHRLHHRVNYAPDDVRGWVTQSLYP